MNELLKILSEIFKEENIKENKDKFKNLKELYHFCISKGYTKDISVFESDYKKLVEEYSKTLELSDSDLESISGGVNNTFKSSVAMLMTALSLSSNASNMVSAASNNYANQNSITQKTSDWIKSKYNTVSEKTTEWLKARSKNEITAMKAIGGTLGLGLGLGLVSVPVIALASKNPNNYKNVQTLVVLLKNSESYINTSNHKKLSLIKKAYSELGIQIDKQKEISTDIQTVQNNLALTIKTKIKSLCELDKNHKDIKILTSFLQLTQPIQSQDNTQTVNEEQNQDNTQTSNSKPTKNDTKPENMEQIEGNNDVNTKLVDNKEFLKQAVDKRAYMRIEIEEEEEEIPDSYWD